MWGADLPLGDSIAARGLQGEVVPQPPAVQDPHSQTGTNGCLTRYLIFTIFGVDKGLWDLLSCLPPLALPVLHMAVQEPLARSSVPLLGVQTAPAPWPGFLGCLMAAGALNLSRGLSRAARARGDSAIPAMCPLSRDRQQGEMLSRRAPQALSS